MIKRIRRKIKKVFRELLLYHNSSLEYRAKVFTLVIASTGEMSQCEEKLLIEIASHIYHKDEERSEILVEAVKEYHNKIITDNGLGFDHLVLLVEKETKTGKRFSKKIDTKTLSRFQACISNEDDKIYQQRVIDYLGRLKKQHGSL